MNTHTKNNSLYCMCAIRPVYHICAILALLCFCSSCDRSPERDPRVTVVTPVTHGRGVGTTLALVGSRKITAERLRVISKAVLDFEKLKGRLPASIEELLDCANASPLCGVPATELQDPWGNRFRYTLDARGEYYFLNSYGSDGSIGGQGDALDFSVSGRRKNRVPISPSTVAETK